MSGTFGCLVTSPCPLASACNVGPSTGKKPPHASAKWHMCSPPKTTRSRLYAVKARLDCRPLSPHHASCVLTTLTEPRTRLLNHSPRGSIFTSPSAFRGKPSSNPLRAKGQVSQQEYD